MAYGTLLTVRLPRQFFMFSILFAPLAAVNAVRTLA